MVFKLYDKINVDKFYKICYNITNMYGSIYTGTLVENCQKPFPVPVENLCDGIIRDVPIDFGIWLVEDLFGARWHIMRAN